MGSRRGVDRRGRRNGDASDGGDLGGAGRYKDEDDGRRDDVRRQVRRSGTLSHPAPLTDTSREFRPGSCREAVGGVRKRSKRLMMVYGT